MCSKILFCLVVLAVVATVLSQSQSRCGMFMQCEENCCIGTGMFGMCIPKGSDVGAMCMRRCGCEEGLVCENMRCASPQTDST